MKKELSVLALGSAITALVSFLGILKESSADHGTSEEGASAHVAEEQEQGRVSRSMISGHLQEAGFESKRLLYKEGVVITEVALARFNEWALGYLNAEPEEKENWVERGVALARARLAELEDLIQADPKRALEVSFPRGQRKSLPPAVQEFLERPISRRGNLIVRAAVPKEEGSIKVLHREAEVDGDRYEAFVYGRMEGAPTLFDIPLSGIAVGQFLALSESPARELDAEERRSWSRGDDVVCSISGASVGEEEKIMLEVAGEVSGVCSAGHVEEVNRLALASGLNSNFGIEEGYFKPHSAYTEGIKKLIIIRVDFPDAPGEPFTWAAGTNLIAELRRFYSENSYSRATFELAGAGSAVTPIYRMPRPATWYGTNDPTRLRTDARAAATQAGTNLSTFHFDLICFNNVPGYQWGGFGYIGAPGAWMQGGASIGIAAHELGHNFGLQHANFWETGGASIIGSGSAVEYGDKFDTMGSAGAGSKHFNARYKNYLNWLRSTEVQTVTTSGQYRIYPHDDAAITNGIRGLRVVRNNSTNYWLEFRTRYSGNKWLPEGVGLRWAGNDGRATLLLDTTPGSGAGKDDSALMIGRTFSDRQAGLHITPVGRGGAGTDPYLDLVINRGSFANNEPPVVAILATRTNVVPGGSITFTASALDPNNDVLAYFWDYGDGSWGSNEAVASKSWSAAGEYVVQCTVSDMKGGVAIGSVLVRVGSPNTFTITGQVTDGVKGLGGVNVSAGSRTTSTDSNGRYYLTGLSSGSYTIKAVAEGYVFSRIGFSNPVTLTSPRANVDFFAIRSDAERGLTLVPAGAVWFYKDDGSNLGTTWRGAGYSEATWSAGPAPLGYGDDNEKTPLRFGPDPNNKHITTYFRHRFVVEDRSGILGLTLGLRRDDGGVVYLNGREVFRSNMPGGTITHTTLASSAVGGADENHFFETEIDPAVLLNGTNLLAVEIHQVSRTSSDLVFDLRLEAVTLAAMEPAVVQWSLLSNGSLELRWPESAASWVVSSSAELRGGGGWGRLNIPITLQDGYRRAVIPMTNKSQFFRLER